MNNLEKIKSLNLAEMTLFFVEIEKDKDYYKASVERLKDAQSQLKLF